MEAPYRGRKALREWWPQDLRPRLVRRLEFLQVVRERVLTEALCCLYLVGPSTVQVLALLKGRVHLVVLFGRQVFAPS